MHLKEVHQVLEVLLVEEEKEIINQNLLKNVHVRVHVHILGQVK
jgi:hypothetical protein